MMGMGKWYHNSVKSTLCHFPALLGISKNHTITSLHCDIKKDKQTHSRIYKYRIRYSFLLKSLWKWKIIPQILTPGSKKCPLWLIRVINYILLYVSQLLSKFIQPFLTWNWKYNSNPTHPKCKNIENLRFYANLYLSDIIEQWFFGSTEYYNM